MLEHRFLSVDELEFGEYYWVIFYPNRYDCELTVCRYRPKSDIRSDMYPWEIVGSDEIFKSSEVKAICKCGNKPLLSEPLSMQEGLDCEQTARTDEE